MKIPNQRPGLHLYTFICYNGNLPNLILTEPHVLWLIVHDLCTTQLFPETKSLGTHVLWHCVQLAYNQAVS
jgi:hypothetical protein